MNDILIYGDIGYEVVAKNVVASLEQCDGGPVTVRVSSNGGDVYEGIAIMNALRSYAGEVLVVIDSIAASAASFIAIGGGDRVVIRPNAELMIHKAWTMQVGNADELRAGLPDLDRQDAKIAAIYAEKAGGDPDQWLEIMSAETWYSADEALAAGLVDAVEDARVSASVRAPVLAKSRVRNRYSGRAVAPPPMVVNNDIPDGGGKEGTVSALEELANTFGVEVDDFKNRLSAFFNSEVEVTAPMVLTYPDEVTVIPTGNVEIAPESDLPDGVTVEATVGEGFTSEVSAEGKVTVRAGDGVKVGDSTDVVLTFPDGAETTVKVTVVAADDGEDTAPTPAADPGVPVDPVAEAEGMKIVPLAFYEELMAAYENQAAVIAKNAARDRDDEITGWINEGRFAAAKRAKVAADYDRDVVMCRETWGSLPKGSIPRNELGSGVDPSLVETGVPSSADLLKLAEIRRNNK
ncbi:head maturation protease, ClpP-related [Corynebacterium rouxii]|uniref:head maturation protease, ClpP-related n=1 Tax=Corynebacterium rouxii TaxID=2719119 RepID=UPI003CF5C3A6